MVRALLREGGTFVAKIFCTINQLTKDEREEILNIENETETDWSTILNQQQDNFQEIYSLHQQPVNDLPLQVRNEEEEDLADQEEFVMRFVFQQYFQTVLIFKPESSRPTSSEVLLYLFYLVLSYFIFHFFKHY